VLDKQMLNNTLYLPGFSQRLCGRAADGVRLRFVYPGGPVQEPHGGSRKGSGLNGAKLRGSIVTFRDLGKTTQS